MAFLISAVSDLIHDPGGLWELLILKVFKFIGNYGWRILFFTICLKLLLFPLDLYQRFKMRKNQLITERLQPQLEKLQQQYAGDKQTLSQKQMELNKREGYSYFSSCLPMIVTLVIFFYLFAGLNNISQYKQFEQYVELYDAYTAVEVEKKEEQFAVTVNGNEELASWNELYARQQGFVSEQSKYKDDEGNWLEGGQQEWTEKYQPTVTALQQALENTYSANIRPAAQQAVVVRYNEVKESFLWIGNIWSPDVPWRKAILSHSQFMGNIDKYKSYGKAASKLDIDTSKLDSATFSDMLSQTKYDNVTGLLRSSRHNRANGFLILPILSVGLSFLSQFITSRLQKKAGQVAPQGGMAGSMKMMMVIMPVMMGIFALTYTAMFTLYIVVNSATTILINVFTTLAMEGKSKRTQKKQTTGIQKYGRPDPKDL